MDALTVLRGYVGHALSRSHVVTWLGARNFS